MSNKRIKSKLARIYGKGCFMERAGIRYISPEKEKQLRIKGYKKISRKLTYHHIVPKSQGGEETTENGAILAEYNHVWLHQQSPEVREAINRQLQDFKFSINAGEMIGRSNGLDVRGKSFTPDINESVSIRAYDTTDKDLEKKRKYDRAKAKKSFQKIVDDEWER